MPGRPNMTALRAVRPARACDAWSSGPAYASTSTMRPARRPRASTRTSVAPRIARAASTGDRSSAPRGRIALGVEDLEPVGDQEPEDREEARDERVAEQDRRVCDPSSAVQKSRRNGSSCGSAAMPGRAKYESRITSTAPKISADSMMPEDAAEDLVDEAGLRRRAAGTGRSPGPRARTRSPRRRTRSRTRSCRLYSAWGTGSSSARGSRPAARRCWRRRRTRTGSTAIPIRRRIVPWAKPSTKNPTKHRKISRSTV